MISHLVKPLSFVIFLTLSACGGGGGGGDTGGGGGGGGGVDPTPGSNGLPFGAVVGQDLTDAEGEQVTMSAASVQFNSLPGIAPASITVNTNFFTGDSDGNLGPLDGSIEIFGQTVPITDGTGTLLDGEVINVIYEPNRTGDHVAAIEVLVGSQNGINGAAAYLIGFETNPNTIAQTGGTTTYVRDFQVAGRVADANTETEYEGQISVEVNFVDDDADFTLLGNFDGSSVVNMSGNGLDIVDNSIAGRLDCTTGCDGLGSSAVDATFYGSNADELGGVLAIDITVTGVGAYDGVGTFILPAQ